MQLSIFELQQRDKSIKCICVNALNEQVKWIERTIHIQCNSTICICCQLIHFIYPLAVKIKHRSPNLCSLAEYLINRQAGRQAGGRTKCKQKPKIKIGLTNVQCTTTILGYNSYSQISSDNSYTTRTWLPSKTSIKEIENEWKNES